MFAIAALDKSVAILFHFLFAPFLRPFFGHDAAGAQEEEEEVRRLRAQLGQWLSAMEVEENYCHEARAACALSIAHLFVPFPVSLSLSLSTTFLLFACACGHDRRTLPPLSTCLSLLLSLMSSMPAGRLVPRRHAGGPCELPGGGGGGRCSILGASERRRMEGGTLRAYVHACAKERREEDGRQAGRERERRQRGGVERDRGTT